MFTAIHGVVAGSGGISGGTWDISTATYASGPYDVGTQSPNPYDVVFGDSGLKMYVFDVGTDTVFQYTLGTKYEVGTASYDSKSKLITDEDTAPYSIAFSSDGLKMYVGGDTTDSVWQYSLSPAWDVSTATSDIVSEAVVAWPVGLAFNTTGTEMYVLSGVGSSVQQYTLSSGWDLSTSLTTGNSGSLTGQDSEPRGVTFKTDGTKMYIIGATNNAVYQYSLSPAWDITSKSYDSISFDISGEETNPSAVRFDDTGTKMYITGIAGTDEVFQYTVSTAWDISTAVYIPTGTAKSKLVSGQDVTPRGLTFSDDGTIMYVLGDTFNTVFQYTLSPAWDVSSAVYAIKSKDVGTEELNPSGVTFGDAGTKMYIVGFATGTVYQYTLGTAWDLGGTVTYASKSKLVTAQDGTPRGVQFSTTGDIMYVVGGANDTIYQYTLSIAWDLGSTVTYATKSKDVSGQNTGLYGACFGDDGTKMYTVGIDTDTVHQYTLGTAWDLGGTVTYASKLKLVTNEETFPSDVFLGDNGFKMYIVGFSTDTVHQYTLE